MAPPSMADGLRADAPRDCHYQVPSLGWIDERGAGIAADLGFMEREGQEFADAFCWHQEFAGNFADQRFADQGFAGARTLLSKVL